MQAGDVRIQPEEALHRVVNPRASHANTSTLSHLLTSSHSYVVGPIKRGTTRWTAYASWKHKRILGFYSRQWQLVSL